MTNKPGEAVDIRVCLVDDQRLMREGLRILLELEEGLAVVGEAEDGQAALKLYEDLHQIGRAHV